LEHLPKPLFKEGLTLFLLLFEEEVGRRFPRAALHSQYYPNPSLKRRLGGDVHAPLFIPNRSFPHL
jgi:hypothetical protein